MEFTKLTSQEFFNEKSADVWRIVKNCSQKGFLGRFTAIPAVAVVSGIKLIGDIVSVAERSIKGAANLAIFPFKEKASFKIGLMQTLSVPCAMVKVGCTPLLFAGRAIWQPLSVLCLGEYAAAKRMEHYGWIG